MAELRCPSMAPGFPGLGPVPVRQCTLADEPHQGYHMDGLGAWAPTHDEIVEWLARPDINLALRYKIKQQYFRELYSGKGIPKKVRAVQDSFDQPGRNMTERSNDNP